MHAEQDCPRQPVRTPSSLTHAAVHCLSTPDPAGPRTFSGTPTSNAKHKAKITLTLLLALLPVQRQLPKSISWSTAPTAVCSPAFNTCTAPKRVHALLTQLVSAVGPPPSPSDCRNRCTHLLPSDCWSKVAFAHELAPHLYCSSDG